MPERTSTPCLRLAGAFLALGDVPGPPVRQSSALRSLAALAAAAVLALAAPLAWASAALGHPPGDQVVAATAKDSDLAGEADEDDRDDDGPAPAGDGTTATAGGATWAATAA